MNMNLSFSPVAYNTLAFVDIIYKWHLLIIFESIYTKNNVNSVKIN